MPLSKEDFMTPPTVEEINAKFDAPTEEELKAASEVPYEESSALGAAARGGLSGLTMDFGDEALGGIQALGSKIAAPITGEQASLGELYTKYRDAQRAANKQAEEEHPYAYLGGSLAGGLGTMALMPELGVGKFVAGATEAEGLGAVLSRLGVTGASKLTEEQLTKVLAETGVKNIGELGLSQLAKGGVQKEVAKELGKQALIGGAEMGAQGALMGAGSSKGDVGSKEFLGDVAKGATFGAVAGGLITPTGQAVSPLAKYGIEKLVPDLEHSPLLRQTATAYGDVIEGRTSVGEATRGKFDNTLRGSAEDFTNKLIGIEENAGEELQKVLKTAGEQGVVVHSNDALGDIFKQLSAIKTESPVIAQGAEFTHLFDQFEKLSNQQLLPIEAWETAKYLEKFSKKYSTSIPALRNIASGFSSEIRNVLKGTITGFEEQSNKFRDLRTAGRDMLASGNIPEDVRDTWISDSRYPTEETFKDVLDVFSKMSQSNASTAKQAGMADKLVENFQKIETKYPGTLEKMGYDSIGSFKKDLQTRGDRGAIGKAILGDTSKGGTLGSVPDVVVQALTLGSSPTPRGTLYSLAQKAAKGKKIVNSIFGATKETANNIGTKLVSAGMSDKSRKVGKSLLDALKNNDNRARNAALFLIQQDPEMRDSIMGLHTSGDGDEQQ